MAERITELPPPRLGARPKYPWDRWTDGSVWTIKRGVDFHCPVPSMQSNLRNKAIRSHGRLTVITRKTDAPDSIAFQFLTSDHERVAA